MSDRNESEPRWPTTEEIYALLDEHKGTAYVWRMLQEQYGPAKGSYGSHVRLAIRTHRQSTDRSIGASTNADPSAHSNVPSNATPLNSGSEKAGATEHSVGGIPMSIEEEEYIKAWPEIRQIVERTQQCNRSQQQTTHQQPSDPFDMSKEIEKWAKVMPMMQLFAAVMSGLAAQRT